ncbi:hypothetical protein CLH39_10230 [Alcaligenes faecalis]|uniref:copper chaperone PCu(A)C n=1 Tax=Alcaligenes faecalis TaxID=511 RepID=UPI0019349BF9|nr:copper chaperone PCu(A)C [Alcaligenes faecalis]QRF90585.1 hypothetical protein CLH39_10230 [Alcaligenes faecalis]
MNKLTKLVTILALSAVGTAFAHGYKAGPIEIEHPWSRATVEQATTGAVYLVLRNPSKQEDRLLSASTPAAEKVELHTHIHDGDVMRMRQINAIDISPESNTTLEPSGLHLMLIGLKQPLVKGKAFPMTLVFEQAGPVTVQIDVQGLKDRAPSHSGSEDTSADHSHGHSHSH